MGAVEWVHVSAGDEEQVLEVDGGAGGTAPHAAEPCALKWRKW